MLDARFAFYPVLPDRRRVRLVMRRTAMACVPLVQSESRDDPHQLPRLIAEHLSG